MSRLNSVRKTCRAILLVIALSPVTGCGPANKPGGATNNGGKTGDETPAYAMPESDASGASEAEPQVVNGDVFEDYHYALRLRRPSSDWRFLDSRKVQSLNADSFMGLVNPSKQGFMVMIGEPMEGITLEGYVDLILDNMPIVQGTRPEKTAVQVDGCPGIVVKRSATVQGMDFTYRIQFVKREDFFYQMMAWTMVDKYAQVEPDFVAIANSLSFVRDRQPQVPDTADSQDDEGVDWRIADNVYSNASFGFQLTPTEGFRLTGHNELTTMNPDASAGIVCSKPTFYQVYIVEPVGDVERDAFTQFAIAQVEQELGINDQDAKVSDVRVGGIDARQYSYQKADLGGAEFDVCETIFYRDALFFRIQSWWPSAEAEQSSLRLPESYAHLQWLDETQRAELAASLAQSDVNNAVGPQYGYRQGVFRDFEFGYTLKTPPGLWQAITGDALQQQTPDARLQLTMLSEGVQVAVIPETLDMNHAEYHAVLRQGLDVADEVPTRTERRGDMNLLVSAFPKTIDDTDFCFRLVTAVRGQRHVQLLVSALQSNERYVDQRLPEIIAGFDFPQTPPTMIETRGATILDHRLGFQVTSPSGGSFENFTPPQIQAIGTMFMMGKPNGAFVVMAICAPLGFDEELAVDALIQNSQINVDPNSRVESESTLAGLPAKQVVMSGQQGRDKAFVKMWMAKRAHTMYLMLALGKEGSREQRESESIKRCLTLID